MVSFHFSRDFVLGFRSKMYPVAVAAHPEKANQFAVGLSVGGVMVIEPLEGEEEWGFNG